jgi:hypothetical protein
VVERSILVVPRSQARRNALIAVAEALAVVEGNHDVLLARLVGPWEQPPSVPSDLAESTRSLNLLRDELLARGTPCRVVAFTSDSPAEDLARMASEYPVDLVLVDATLDPAAAGELPEALMDVLERVECDVAIFVDGDAKDDQPEGTGPVVTPFGGATHDWAAVQLASWFATARGVPLRLLGSTADVGSGQRDASRLLAKASLIVQQMAGVVAEPALVEPGAGVVEEVQDAGLVVMGLSDRWKVEGLGPVRAEIARAANVPVLILRRGTRSQAALPSGELTRFGWSRARSARP